MIAAQLRNLRRENNRQKMTYWPITSATGVRLPPEAQWALSVVITQQRSGQHYTDCSGLIPRW
jgi:hypothetical protein